MEIILHKNNNKFLCAFKHRNYKSVSLIIRATEYMYNYTNVLINNYETSQQEQQTLIELYRLCVIRMYPRGILGISPSIHSAYPRHILGIPSIYPRWHVGLSSYEINNILSKVKNILGIKMCMRIGIYGRNNSTNKP